MGGAWSLKLEGRGARARAQRGAIIFFCFRGPNVDLFSYCVAGSRGRAPGQGVRGKASLKLKHF